MLRQLTIIVAASVLIAGCGDAPPVWWRLTMNKPDGKKQQWISREKPRQWGWDGYTFTEYEGGTVFVEGDSFVLEAIKPLKAEDDD